MGVCMASVSIHGGEGVGSRHCKAPSFAMVQRFLLLSRYHYCSMINDKSEE